MDNGKRKSLTYRIISIALLIILIPVILVNLIMIIKTYARPDHLPDVFGIKPAIVLSGSMSPLFETNALIFVKEIDTDELTEGDVICFLQGGTAITHRIEKIILLDGEQCYITKGDANNTVDQLTVSSAQIEGRYIGRIAGIGKIVLFMLSTLGMFLFIAVTLIIYIVFDLISKNKESRKEKVRTSELEKELERLRAEQRIVKAAE